MIHCDLGLSGRSAARRDGFKQLVARICLGEVGAVFGLEVSRLARSNADVARLLEPARFTDTLVIDTDGIYDLSDINDRLLLGLKGQMGEAEPPWPTSRMNEAKGAAAARGELRLPLPAGFVYDEDQNVVIDPDEEIATAIADVFAAFTATGSAYGVAGAFAGRRFPRRAYGGVWAGQVRWGRLTHARAAAILRNPDLSTSFRTQKATTTTLALTGWVAGVGVRRRTHTSTSGSTPASPVDRTPRSIGAAGMREGPGRYRGL
ncbi:recombinase family protein, partial [Nonomuraea sp. JJY05]|uniref:recombinase family protein n=1 Tax=Nonomuraea sp. JJY05 TaxID=3350255 RepID=UPI00373FA0DC